MDLEANKRIDAGIPRGKRRMRQEARQAPRTALGTFAPRYTPERRAEIILGVPEAIRSGMTTAQYAQKHEMPVSTLQAWILGSQVIEDARGEFLAHELMIRIGEIDTATDPLSLARAREAFRAWSWIAERREHRLYGQKQELTGKDGGPIQVQIVRYGNTIEGETVSNTPNAALLTSDPALPKPK